MLSPGRAAPHGSESAGAASAWERNFQAARGIHERAERRMVASGFEGIEEERVGSLGELLDRVTPREHDPVSGRIRDTSVYRGSGSPEWPLLTSLDRLGGAHPPHTKALPPVAFLVQDLDAMLQARGIASLGELMARPHIGGARFVCMLDPPALDDRIIAQSATFTISTDKTQPFERILREEGLSHALTRYLIPKERVNYVRDQLDLCALDERKLFPDLDGVAAQLRRYYSPSGRRGDSADPGIRHAESGEGG